MALGDGFALIGTCGDDSGVLGIADRRGGRELTKSGAAYVFDHSEAGWEATTFVKPRNALAEDLFGMTVALTEEGFVVGALRGDARARAPVRRAHRRRIPAASTCFGDFVRLADPKGLGPLRTGASYVTCTAYGCVGSSIMDSGTWITLFTVFECTAVLFVLLGVPLMRRTARLNLPGRFVSRSMERDSAEWRAVNAAAGRDLIIIGLTLAPLALAMLWVRPSLAVFALAGCGWLSLGATGILLHSYLMMTRHPHY